MPPPAGARIANGRGIPGTLGSFAMSLHDGAVVLLSNHHVLFGAGAGGGDAVWLMAADDEVPGFVRLGGSLYGRLGTVLHRNLAHFVDCAVASVEAWAGLPAGWRVEAEHEHVANPLRPGAIVTKKGGATGLTRGVVVDVDGRSRALVAGRSVAAPRQILVRSLAAGEPFSAEGDSGAILRDEAGAAVGLLWGTTAGGESIASAIAPVLQVLGIRLVELVPREDADPTPLRSLTAEGARRWRPTKS